MTRPPDPHPDDDTLEQRLEAAWGQAAWDQGASGMDATDAGPKSAPDVIGPAFARFRTQRRRRLTAAGTVCVALLGIGWLALPPQTDEAPAVETANAVAYGNELYRRVMHEVNRQDDDDLDYLVRDADARAEYLAALDHPSSHVRRIAVSMLARAGITIPGATLTALLVEHREDLERPLQVASVGDAGRLIAEAIERRRIATLQRILGATHSYAARGTLQVDMNAFLPFLEHENSTIRGEALNTLSYAESFVPGDRVRRLMREDPEIGIRTKAAEIIQRRLGAAGGQEVLAYLQTLDHPALEKQLMYCLSKVEGFPAVARQRYRRSHANLDLALAYARALYRLGDDKPAREHLPRLFRHGHGEEVAMGVGLAAEMNWRAMRSAIIEALPRQPKRPRRMMTSSLARWDFRRGSEAEIVESMTLLGEHGGVWDVPHLRKYAVHPAPAVKRAVAAAIAAIEAR